MPKKNTGDPLPLEIPKSMAAKLERWAKARKTSHSEVTRYAIETCRFAQFTGAREEMSQKSFRLPGSTRRTVKAVARQHRATLAEVVRFAIGQLPDRPPREVKAAKPAARRRMK